MGFDFRHLEAFLKVAETGSFSRAARELFKTQPTLSHTIKELESSVGIRLLDRRGKTVVPTRAGRSFIPLAKKIVRLRDEALASMASLAGTPRGELPIGGSNIPGEYILPILLPKFSDLFPEVKMRILVGDTQGIIDSVSEGHLEIGLVGTKPKGGRLTAVPCFDDRLVVIFPRRHRWWGEPQIRLDHLLTEPFLIREPGSGTRTTLEIVLKKNGLAIRDLRVIGEIGSTEGIKQAVMAGLGVSVISNRAVTLEVAENLLGAAPIKDLNLRRSFFLIHPPAENLSPLAKLLVSFLKAEGGESTTKPLQTRSPV